VVTISSMESLNTANDDINEDENTSAHILLIETG
jgi:hypothetical protein